MTFLPIIKDSLIAAASIATVIAAIAAIRGLKTWRNQLKGTDEYKASEEILKRAFKLEDALRSARIPWISSGENAQRLQEERVSGTEDMKEKEIKNEAYALWKRMEPVFKAVSELKISKFKAMALWDRNSIQNIDLLIKKAYELKSAQNIYSHMKLDPALKDREAMNKYLKIVYEGPKDEDTFWKAVENIIQKIGRDFRPYLET